MEITKDDVPYQLHTMVEIVGYHRFLEICKMYGGTAVYIPVYRKVVMSERNKQIIKEFNGRNINALSIKYNLSKEQVKRIIESEEI
ncbi:MAG: Mor transcription activator family protein [Terrisporobacter sp.]